MELQIEKNLVAALRQRTDDRWAFEGEQSAADLERTGDVTQGIGERQGAGATLHVERDYELIHALCLSVVSSVPVTSEMRARL